jgi:hypothetical protein
MVYQSLVILIQDILFLCEIVRLQRDRQFMRWLRRDLQALAFGFVDPFYQVEVCITFPGLFAGFWVKLCRILDIGISENVLIEAVQGLSLPLGCMVLVGVEPYGVMWTA